MAKALTKLLHSLSLAWCVLAEFHYRMEISGKNSQESSFLNRAFAFTWKIDYFVPQAPKLPIEMANSTDSHALTECSTFADIHSDFDRSVRTVCRARQNCECG